MKKADKYLLGFLFISVTSGSCAVIAPDKIDVSVSVAEEGILSEGETLYLSLSCGESDSAVKDQISLQEFFSEKYIRIETAWSSPGKIMITPMDPLSPGKRYLLTMNGPVKTETGAVRRLQILHSFYYATHRSPVYLSGCRESTVGSVGTMDPITFNFSGPMDIAAFEKEFSTMPAADLKFNWTLGETEVRAEPESGWKNLQSYTWRIPRTIVSADGQQLARDYEGHFIVQLDSDPPHISGTETGRLDESSGNFISAGYGTDLIDYKSAIRLIFSEAVSDESVMDAFSIIPETRGRLWKETPASWLFIPDDGWRQSTNYLLLVTRDLTDLSGNRMNKEFRESFTTAVRPVVIESVSARSIAGGNVTVPEPPGRIPVSVTPDLPSGSLSVTVQLSTANYDTPEERLIFLNAVAFRGYLPPVTDPVLESYEWLAEDRLVLYYSGVTVSSTNAPWQKQLYRFSIAGGKQYMNNEGEFPREEVVVVFSACE